MKTATLLFVLLIASSFLLYYAFDPERVRIRDIQNLFLAVSSTPISEEKARTFMARSDAELAGRSQAPSPTPTPSPTPVPAVPTTYLPTPTATPVPTPATLSFSSMVAMARPSVVRIDTSVGAGSGVIFETDGESALVLTNAHVVGYDATVDVTVKDTSPYTGLVRGVDAMRDLAVVRICCGSFSSLQFGAAELGDEVALVGYPLSQHLLGSATVTKGVVSAFRYDAEGQRHFVQTDAAANPGNSGGPMLNMRGEIVGILTLGYRDAEGVSFAVSTQTAMRTAHTLKTQAPPATPTLVPMQEGKQYLRVVESAGDNAHGGLFNFYVEYVNNTTIIAYGVLVDIQFFDANKQPLTAVIEEAGRGVSDPTLPGERGFASGQVNNLSETGQLPEKWHSYQVSVRIRSLPETIIRSYRDHSGLRITNLRHYYGTDGFQHIAGTATNEEQRETRRGKVFAVIRKSNGALHEVKGDYFASPSSSCGGELAPGESCQFDISLVRELPPGGSYAVKGVSW